MRWSLHAFLRYLHFRVLTPLALAGCVPSIRQWKLASLPTYLSAAQVQKVLDGCDRTTALGRRDYAILMKLAKLGLRANEVATLAPDDIDWRSGEMLVRAKGRQRARIVAVNLGGMFRGMRESARRLRDGGRIINISTSVVSFYHPNFACSGEGVGATPDQARGRFLNWPGWRSPPIGPISSHEGRRPQ